MRVNAIGSKTWLLGAVAAWALCVGLLAFLGLGSRIERLPNDPSLIERLPRYPATKPDRLGPLPQYGEIGARPLFSNDRRPRPFLINPENQGEGAAVFDLVLTGVLLTPNFRMAIVQAQSGGVPMRLKLGDAPDSAPLWTLTAIKPRSAVFDGPDGERTLELRVFDGIVSKPSVATPAQSDSSSSSAQPAPVWTEPPTVSASGEVVDLQAIKGDKKPAQQARETRKPR